MLQLPRDQASLCLKVRTIVGLLPLYAVTVFESDFAEKYPDYMKRFRGFLEGRPDLVTLSLTEPCL
jgi:hypothetical protein